MTDRITRRTVHVDVKRGDIWLLTTERYYLADGLTIRLREHRGARGKASFIAAGDFLIERLESFPFDVAAGLAGAWLYDVLKGHRATVSMDGKSVSADDKGKLRRFLREHILRRATTKPDTRRPSKRGARPKAVEPNKLACDGGIKRADQRLSR